MGPFWMVGWTSILCQLSWSWNQGGRDLTYTDLIYFESKSFVQNCSPSHLLAIRAAGRRTWRGGIQGGCGLGRSRMVFTGVSRGNSRGKMFPRISTCFHHEDMGVFEDLWSGPPSGSGWFEKILGGSVDPKGEEWRFQSRTAEAKPPSLSVTLQWKKGGIAQQCLY